MKVTYEKKGKVGWITFNRPEKLNALDRESWYLLSTYLKKANEDREINAVVLTGNGRAFSAGDDIHAMYELKSVEEAREFFSTLYEAIESLMNLDKPLICLVNGLAYGGGCEILLLCDIVIASENAKLSIPEGKLGLIPPMAVTIGYKALGRSISRLVLTGEEISAEEAKAIGLVDYVSRNPEEDLKRVLSLLERIDSDAIIAMKRWLRSERKLVEKAVIELALLSQTLSAKNRMKEFIDRRKSG